jgi:demethylmenaquinone methyltransferase/2-methoxy-6-polyprenyl-1,4-benzoquinol methylase
VSTNDDSLIKQQLEYYRARAGEYDEWFLREGRYDRGEEHRKQWFAEVDQVRAALAKEHPGGEVLELACGTGLWTTYLLERSRRLVAVDASQEVLTINRARTGDQPVEYVKADLFSWTPTEQFDFVFFSFWLSHVPLSRFDDFWEMVQRALGPGGKVFVVDSALTPESTAQDHKQPDRSGVVTRKLNDGRKYEIVKIFHEPAELENRLGDLGWHGVVHSTGQFFYYGVFGRE